VVASLSWRLQTGILLTLAVDPRLWDPRLLWGTLVLAAAIAVGVMVIAILKRWREYETAEEPSANEQLAHFRQLYEQGELSDDEFARIKARLSEQLRQELDMPAAPPTDEEPPDSSADAPANPPP
jgi:hypothetical protein